MQIQIQAVQCAIPADANFDAKSITNIIPNTITNTYIQIHIIYANLDTHTNRNTSCAMCNSLRWYMQMWMQIQIQIQIQMQL